VSSNVTCYVNDGILQIQWKIELTMEDEVQNGRQGAIMWDDYAPLGDDDVTVGGDNMNVGDDSATGCEKHVNVRCG